MVHASLRAIGPVERDADGVIDALQAAVGPAGTLLMVLGAEDPWAWVNERPEEVRAALLADATPFDAWQTASDPEVGALAEVFRRRPGTVMSDHPEGRFAAWGRRAMEFTTDVPWDDYFGPGSPLERFVEAGGRVLRMGADENTTTLLHYAEYVAPIAPKRRIRRHRLVAGPGGPSVRVVDALDDEAGIVDYSPGDYFTVILRQFLSDRRPRRGRVGGAPSELIDGNELVSFAVAWMERHLA